MRIVEITIRLKQSYADHLCFQFLVTDARGETHEYNKMIEQDDLDNNFDWLMERGGGSGVAGTLEESG